MFSPNALLPLLPRGRVVLVPKLRQNGIVLVTQCGCGQTLVFVKGAVIQVDECVGIVSLQAIKNLRPPKT